MLHLSDPALCRPKAWRRGCWPTSPSSSRCSAEQGRPAVRATGSLSGLAHVRSCAASTARARPSARLQAPAEACSLPHPDPRRPPWARARQRNAARLDSSCASTRCFGAPCPSFFHGFIPSERGIKQARRENDNLCMCMLVNRAAPHRLPNPRTPLVPCWPPCPDRASPLPVVRPSLAIRTCGCATQAGRCSRGTA